MLASMTEPDPGIEQVIRSAVRVVLSDADGRVLLLHITEPQHPDVDDCWELPGGGIDPGESLVEAAQRELVEETGLSIPEDDIGPPHWFRSVSFLHAGKRRFQDEAIVHAVVRQSAPVVQALGFSDDERETFVGYRWWDVADIEAGAGRFFPGSLPALLRRFLDGDRIDEPFERFS
jgi:8-oxo-dGTP pyrophosphatase MutT (NUDIX family)